MADLTYTYVWVFWNSGLPSKCNCFNSEKRAAVYQEAANKHKPDKYPLTVVYENKMKKHLWCVKVNKNLLYYYV